LERGKRIDECGGDRSLSLESAESVESVESVESQESLESSERGAPSAECRASDFELKATILRHNFVRKQNKKKRKI
jgi:hypothetical protein